ncbi:hypothetical protein FIBSPDRAFT_903594 [Athelia psychrophila]|uniref:F-box domain-containing protein n=1 Tax=Athelia psychrophila TaxID=1759441 RepID=A0A167VT02_9AGAM|nr:hypothetical protein FIBSPDRAFT_903594 [Fibularhizoctonia sp. CBS 109695]
MSTARRSSAKFLSSGGRGGIEVGVTREQSDSDASTSADESQVVAKKRRTSSTARSKTAPKARKKLTDISRIMHMPMDVLFEIFKCVGPRDLIHLSRTSKTLRKTLMSKQTISIWKSALAMRDSPDCPDIYSYPRWADLLFGESFCQCCSAKGVQRADFGLGKRICSRCKKEALFPASKLKDRVDALVLDLIPHAIVGASSKKYYWIGDIQGMSKQLKGYQADVSLDKPGAKKALNDFITSRLVLVAQTTIAARNCKEWIVTHAETAKSEKLERKATRYQDILQRLIALGYDERDMVGLGSLSGWNTMRKAVEQYVCERRASRIGRERLLLDNSRKTVVTNVYKEFKASVVPATWAHHPADEVALRFDCFSALINDPSDLPLDVQRCRDVLKDLPGELDALNEEKTAVLLSLLVHSSEEARASVQRDAGAALDLATSIFACCGRHCRGIFVGWQYAICHRCPVSSHELRSETLISRIPDFRFASRASQAVQSLTSLLELDAWSTAVGDLDREDARFVCLACPCDIFIGIRGRKALSWRHCVTHAEESKHAQWQLLTPLEATEVKAREVSVRHHCTDDQEYRWSCNHCPRYLDNLKPRLFVNQHLQTEHGCSQPVEGKDFFYDRRYSKTLFDTVNFGEQVPVASGKIATRTAGGKGSIYHCMTCISLSGSSRAFELKGVISHIQAKHRVKTPKINQDFIGS